MEPRPHERGKESRGGQAPRGEIGFNGATSSRTWKGEREGERENGFHASMEPRPHERGKAGMTRPPILGEASFNGATSSRTWKGLRAVTAQTCPVGFNGATSSRTWKASSSIMSASINSASMEPRPHERGKMVEVMLTVAGLLLQWSHVLTNVERSKPLARSAISLRFNGATSSRTWKVGCVFARFVVSVGFNGATSSRTWKACPLGLRLRRRTGCFNGATSSRTWKELTRR